MRLGSTVLKIMEGDDWEFNFGLGQIVHYDWLERPKSVVVGIDSYTLTPIAGGDKRRWHSYTLESMEGDKERWWAVNVPDLGKHFFTAARPQENADGLELMEELSGEVSIASQGDSSMSGGGKISRGHLKVYKKPDGTLYAEESFSDPPGTAPLKFNAVPSYPFPDPD